MQKTIVRYKLKAGYAEENIRLVKAVYAQIALEKPADFRYTTYQLEDGVSFLHIAIHDGDGKSPISGFSAFQEFQKEIKTRCEELPVVTQATEIGSYQSDPATKEY